MAGEIEVDDRAVLAALRVMVKAGEDPRPAYDDIGRAWHSRLMLQFRQGVDPYGDPWDPPKHRDGQPLRDSGRLQQSYTWRADAEGVELGTNVIYAGIHQTGGVIRAQRAPYLVFKVGDRWARRKSVTIPQRRQLPDQGLPESWSRDALSAVARHLQGGRDGA